MARTSRKARAQSQTDTPEAGIVYNTAGYARLSVEDSGKKDADTIETQKQTITEFIEASPDLRLCRVYSDNGRSGATFDRPGFEEMMDEVRSGSINCIVVKDLSRFGRNYLETGNYLERIFPFMGVRFIAINDNFDTLTAERSSEGYIVPLKNILNDVYSKDISRKICPALRLKQQNGEFIGTWAAYGYRKCADDHHRIEPDEETAPIVRKIFHYRLEGISYTKIARLLNEEGIPSPAKYHYLCGDSKYERYAHSIWETQTVKNLLKNEVYLGHLVQGRKRSYFSQGKLQKQVPKEEWVIVRNTHEALIDEETFRIAQEMDKKQKDIYNSNLGKHDALGKTPNILRGLVFCADCHRKLVRYKSVTCKGTKMCYIFICQTHSNDPASCPKKYLHETILKEVLWDHLRREIELAGSMKQLVQASKRSKAALSWEEEYHYRLAELQQKLDKATMLYDSLFQNYAERYITEKEYIDLKQQYKAEMEALTQQLEDLKKAYAERERKSFENPWVEEFTRFQDATEMTEALAHSLIECIEVGSDNSISITLRYRNEYQDLVDYLAALDVGR